MYPEFTVLKVAKIQGIPITLHWSLALIVVLLVFDWGLPGVLAGVLLFGSVLLHELGHALVARHFGLPIRGITLHLLGGAAVMERHPRTPREELLIAAAGPAVSLALGLVGLSVLFVSGLAADPFAAGFQALVPYFAFLNLAMGVFNLVPALPMDGGRILRALLSPRLGDLRATRVAARVSRVISAIFLLGGLYAGSWTLPLIGLFVFLLARQEEKQAEFREAQRQLEAWELSEGRAHWVPRASPRLS
jgi:Zn-dependent protease